MKKMIFTAALAAMTLVSCNKADVTETPSVTDGNLITLEIIQEQQETRAFFDNTYNAEAWEAKLYTVSIYVFSPTGEFLVRRNFTPTETAISTATFTVPASMSGKTCGFYIVCNADAGPATNEEEFKTSFDQTALTEYNGTIEEVMTRAKRSNGFVMSGYGVRVINSNGSTTSFSMQVRRVVAKIAVQTKVDAGFAAKYGGTVFLNNITLSGAATRANLFNGLVIVPSPMTFTHTQESGSEGGKFQNLFYLYECKTIPLSDMILLELNGVHDYDGNPATTGDQMPVKYEIKLAKDNQGSIIRNSYWRVDVTINGLQGVAVAASIITTTWEPPNTQTVTVG